MERFIEKHGYKLLAVFGLIFALSIIIGLAGCGQGSTSIPKGEVLVLDDNTSYTIENPDAVAHNDNSVVVLGGKNTAVLQSDACGDGGTLADGICIITISSSSSSSSSEAICGEGYIFADGICILSPENEWPTTYDECVVKGWGWVQWTDKNGSTDGACVLDIGSIN